ncbi:DNA mismatch repair protein [Colletotrichum sojae]|uniref:DNA mismatch repair protein MSH5 n=1 Tax=Colletotrichum sojae TaxID=2175907 RepID=A0A8H6IR30_9PEZI|nr:DNA mismatch repair protein [Colletotrichum sojae]
MAINIKGKGSLGCAYYEFAKNQLSLLHDMPSADLHHFFDVLLVHVEPTVVLLPMKMPDEAVKFFEEHMAAISNDGRELQRYVLRMVSSNDFSYSSSVERLANLPAVRSEQAVVAASCKSPGDGLNDALGECRTSKVMRLGSFVDLDCVSSVGCAGAALGEAIRMHNEQRVSGSPARPAAPSIGMFTLSDFMFITRDTLSSLHIFQSELHPTSLMSGRGALGDGSKESLSLYGLFLPLVGTPQGKTKLRQMFARPLINVDEIRERQRSIATLLRPENTETLENITRALGKVKDVRKTLEQLQMGADAPTGHAPIDKGAWWALTRFSLSSLQLRNAVLQVQNAHDLMIFQRVIKEIPFETIKGIGEMVESIVDFEEAKASSRITVKWNVSPQLDELKQRYLGMDSLLNEVHASMSRDLPEGARQHVTGVGFWPQMGFFTMVSTNPGGAACYKGQGLEDRWHVAFVANGSAYCKNRRMEELDLQLGDPYSGIVDLEIQILHDLACEVLTYAQPLSRAADVCGELDCLVSLARGARKYQWTQPTMTTDNVLSIIGGRHPLQELAVPTFIANDCRLEGSPGEDQDTDSSESTNNGVRTLVITGPNHSGKSVYVKQIALIVYLAHLGSFVPASRAVIGITDQILTRIATRESVSRSASAFGIDLKQVAFLLRRATHRSLVVIDEFGKGTAAGDGSGLMAGLIDHFETTGLQTPKVLITTHAHELFESGFFRHSPSLLIGHMRVRLNMSASKQDQLVFLYELTPGKTTTSFGCRCAALNGVEDVVVERAEAIALLLARNEDLRAACARVGEEDEGRLEEAEAVARMFLHSTWQGSSSVPLSFGCSMGNSKPRGSVKGMLRGLVGSHDGC